MENQSILGQTCHARKVRNVLMNSCDKPHIFTYSRQANT